MSFLFLVGVELKKNTPVKNLFNFSLSHSHSLDTVRLERGLEFRHAGGGHIPGKQLLYTGIYGYGMVHISRYHGRDNCFAESDRKSGTRHSQNACSACQHGKTLYG